MRRNKLFLKIAGYDEFISLDLIHKIARLPGGNINATSYEHGYASSFNIDKDFHNWEDIERWMKHLTKEK